MGRTWTEEQKRAQAEKIRKWKPWERSTGPKTIQGKERSSLNAYKHGLYARHGQSVEALLKANRDFIHHLKDFMRQEKRAYVLKAFLNTKWCMNRPETNYLKTGKNTQETPLPPAKREESNY